MPGKGYLNKRRHKGSNVMGEDEARAEAQMRQEWRNGVSNTAPVSQPQAFTPQQTGGQQAFVPQGTSQAFAPPGGQEPMAEG